MSTAPEVAASDVEVFARTFTQAADLAGLSDGARRVLAVAAALFHRRGAAATSVRDITAGCGLTPGALYRHFASKDDLLYTLVDFGHTRMERRIGAALAESGTDPVARLTAFVHAYVMGHLSQPELAQVVRREYLHLSTTRYRAVVRRRRALRSQLCDLVEAGAASGELDVLGGRDNTTRVAVLLLDMCSRTSEWYHAEHDTTPERLADFYTAASLRLLRVDASRDTGDAR